MADPRPATLDIDPPPPASLLTEEGQRVIVDEQSYARRELAKLLPLDEPWPDDAVLSDVLSHYGLGGTRPPARLPFQVASGLFVVGQSRADNRTYLIDCGPDGVALVDPGYDIAFDETLGNIAACGRAPSDVRWVLNTHCHYDHSMANHLFARFGAEILIHTADADAVERGSRVVGYDRRRVAQILDVPEGELPESFPSSGPVRRLHDGEELALGDTRILTVHTPGHTPGSACFAVRVDGRDVLISGDTVLFDGRLGWQDHPYSDDRAYLASLTKLMSFTGGIPGVHRAGLRSEDRWAAARRSAKQALGWRWDLLLPGHGTIVLERAYVDVAKAMDAVALRLGRGQPTMGFAELRDEYRVRMFGRPLTPIDGRG